MKTLNLFTIGLLIVIGLGITQESFGQCTDVPTTPEMGVYSTLRLDYDYRYAPGLSSSNTYLYSFVMLQWWGCCDLNSACNISITTAYGTQPTKDWESTDGVEADFIFTNKGKYVVGASHPGFSNCTGGTSVRVLNFFVTDDLEDRDADDIKNDVDSDADGDGFSNAQDDDDDNDDILDVNDNTPGGEGTNPTMWQQNGWMSSTATPTPTATFTPTPTPTLSMCIIPKMHCPGLPSSGSLTVGGWPGHGMVLMQTNNVSALPTAIQPDASSLNNVYVGKYPAVSGLWVKIMCSATMTLNDSSGGNPIAKVYPISSSANYVSGIEYLVTKIASPGYYTWHSSNCVDFVESLASESSVSLPASTSLYSGLWVSFPGIMGYNIYQSGGWF